MWIVVIIIVVYVLTPFVYALTKKGLVRKQNKRDALERLKNFPMTDTHLNPLQKTLVLEDTKSMQYHAYREEHGKGCIQVLRVPELDLICQAVDNELDTLSIKRINALMYVSVTDMNSRTKKEMPEDQDVNMINRILKEGIDDLLAEDASFRSFYPACVQWTPCGNYSVGIDMRADYNSMEIVVRRREEHGRYIAFCRYRKDLGMWEDGVHEHVLEESKAYLKLLISLGVLQSWEEKMEDIRTERWKEYGTKL